MADKPEQGRTDPAATAAGQAAVKKLDSAAPTAGGDYSLKELKERIKFVLPKERKATEEMYWAVNTRMQHGMRILNATNWWLGYRSRIMGAPFLTTNADIPTACVGFNPVDGRIDFFFNLFFAASLSAGDIAYIIGHECMHLVLGHLDQMKSYGIKHHETWNIVTDAFINEFLDRSLRWQPGMHEDDKTNWTQDHIIRWKQLPKTIQKKFPIDEEGGTSSEITALQIYDAVIDDMNKKGVDIEEFEKNIENKRMGKKLIRKKKIERGTTEATEDVKVLEKPTYTVPGDISFCKTQRVYGIVGELRQKLDNKGWPIGDCDFVTDPSITEAAEWHWLCRACNIVEKNYSNSCEIVNAYSAQKAIGKAPNNFTDLAHLTGMMEIAELDEIDAEIRAWKKANTWTQEEKDAQDEKDAVAKAKAAQARGVDDDVPPVLEESIEDAIDRFLKEGR
jgi:hypothetical protein